MTGDIVLGQYALPVILTVILGLIYKMTDKPDGTSSLDNRWKVAIPMVCGMALGIMALYYRCQTPGSNLAFNFVNFVDYLLYGLMNVGASAIGLYEIQNSVRKSGG